MRTEKTDLSELEVDDVPEHRYAKLPLDNQDLQQALNDLPDEFWLVGLMLYF